jgi:hypothetical protein
MHKIKTWRMVGDVPERYIVTINGAPVCICRACTDPPPRREREPMVNEAELLEAMRKGRVT